MTETPHPYNLEALRPRRFPWYSLVLITLTTLSLGWYFVEHGYTPMREYRGYSAYFTATSVMIHQPELAPQLYEQDRFIALILETGFPPISDIFAPNLPTTTLMMLPFLPFSLAVGNGLYYLLMLPAWTLGLGLLASTLRLPRRWGVWLAAAAWLYAPLRANLSRGQVYVYLFVAVCLIFWLVSRRKETWAGAVAGFLLVVKTAGVWFLLELGVMGRWRWLLAAGAATGSILLLSYPLIGPEVWTTYWQGLPTYLEAQYPPVTAIQSVGGMLRQWFIYDPVWNPTPLAHWPGVVGVLRWGILLVSLGITVWAARPRPRSEAAQLLWLALLMALVVTNAPAAEDYHYLLVLPSFVVAGWWGWQQKMSWRAWVVLGAAFALVALRIKFTEPFFSQGFVALLAYPRVYGAYLLWGWLLWALRREYQLHLLHPPVNPIL